MEKAKVIGVWTVIVLASLAFVISGIGKLSGVEMMHDSFAIMGLPVWFGYFIGVAEVAGGVGLFLRKTSAWAAAGLFIIMLGATYFHIAYAEPSAIPAVILAAMSAVIFIARRQDALFMASRAQTI